MVLREISDSIEAIRPKGTPVQVDVIPLEADQQFVIPDHPLNSLRAPGVLCRATTSDGYEHALRVFPASGPPRGTVVLLHGIQSHSGWYQFTGQQLCGAGWNVVLPDRRGSGLNDVRRGHADHGRQLINDCVTILRRIRKGSFDAVMPSTDRLVLAGLSWGGKTAAATALSQPDLVDGLVLLYPGLTPRIAPTWLQTRQLDLARHFDIRDRAVPVPLDDPRMFTRNSHYCELIRTDPNSLREVTSGFLNAGRDLSQICEQHLGSMNLPVLLLLAGKDEIIDNKSTVSLVTRWSPSPLTLRTFPEARHTLEFEESRDDYVGELTGWLMGNFAADGVSRV